MYKNNKSKTNIIKTLMAMAIILIIVFTVADAMAERWSDNLLTNPGAETGNLSGWTPQNSYHGGFAASTASKKSGTYSFRGECEWCNLYQVVDLSDYVESIKTGTVEINVGGWFLRNDHREKTTIYINGYDGYKYFTIDGKTFTSPNWTWSEYNKTFKLPGKTRKVRIWLDVSSGEDYRPGDVYWDDLFLKISLPEFSWVSSYTVNFGNLYYNTDDTAKAYNKKQTRTFSFKNTGSGKLTYTITPAAGFTINQTKSDGLLPGETNTVTVVFEGIPSGNSNYNKPSAMTIDTTHSGTHGVTAQARFYGTPAVTHVSPAKGSNGKVNIAVDDSVYFAVSSGNPLFPGARIREYEWQSTVGVAQPGSSWVRSSGTKKSFRWSSPGEYTLYCRMVDDNSVATAHVAIPVKVWNRPTVKAKPPKPENVDWYDNTYAGVVGEPVKLQADGELNGNEKIDRYIWLDDAGKELVKQEPGQVVTYQWDKKNLNGRIDCKAITNYGIESGKQHFNYKIYPALEINHGGPYVGKPKKPITLKGSVSNANSYPGAVFQYEWILQKTTRDTLEFVPMGKTTDPTLEATWTKDGERIIRLMVTAITSEGLTLTGSEETTVTLAAGVPTAHPGGPYRGGIAGGNFSPAQFEGNRPDFVEDEDVGKIVKWEWGFGGPTGNTLQFDGKDDYVNVPHSNSLNLSNLTIEAWVKPTGNHWRNILMKGNYGYGFAIDEGNRLRYWISGGSSECLSSTGTVTSEHGQWQHVAVIVNDITTTFYINGTKAGGHSRSTINNNTGALTIGQQGTNCACNYFAGSMDEVRIWNRSLTEAEIAANAQGRKISAKNEPGLVGYWSLDEGSGTTAKDNSSNGNHGTLNNEPKWVFVDNVFGPNATVWNPTHVYPKAGEYTVSLRVQSDAGKWSPVKTTTVTAIDGKIEGYVKAADLRTPVKDVRMTLISSHVDRAILANINTLQSALQFDGVDDYVLIPDNDSLDMGTGSFTLEAWFKSNGDLTQDAWIYIKEETDSHPSYGFRVRADGSLRGGMQNNGSTYTTYGSGYDDSKWHHIAMVVDRQNKTQKMFADGVQVGTTTDISSFGDRNMNSNADAYIGSYHDGNTGCAKATMDEVRVWKRALTQAEIQANMQSRTVSGSEERLVGYWSFDDGRGETAVDNTLNGNHGVLYGNPQWIQFEMPLLSDSDGNVYAMTGGRGFYSFERLPLGEYRIIASKGEGGDFHEFQNEVQVTELTLNGPNQLGLDFVDLSVFPISGIIVYSIQKQGQDVFVKDVNISAQPVGSTSAIKALPSAKSPNATGTNYSLPLFAGKYLFLAERSGHNVRINEKSSGYNKESQLVTIKKAVTNIDFIDHTTRELIVYVEDSGGFPIEEYQDNEIKVQVNGDNGFSEGEVVSEGTTHFKATLPPGKYTVSLPKVPTAIVKGDSSKKEAEVDLTGENGSVTMVVPVPIVLEISGVPKLLDGLTEEQKAKLGLGEGDNPEGYMYYYPPALQTFTYTITVTANGNPVAGFTMFVTDDVSQITEDAAKEEAFTTSVSNFEVDADNGHIVKYKVSGGLPKVSVVDEGDPNTYVIDPDTGKKVPKVLPKPIKFKAEKDGYEKSITYPKEITVLGDLPVGGAQKIVSIPNVNYMVLHDPPGDGSYTYLDDSLTIKGIMGPMQLTIEDKEIPVYPSPWSVERRIKDADFSAIEKSNQDLGQKGLLGYKDSDPTLGHFAAHAILEAATGAGIVVLGPFGYAIQLFRTGAMAGAIAGSSKIQYEVSPNRHIETPSGDELPDIMGPGRGDIYFGEGWTLGLQTKHRLGIKKQGDAWAPETQAILTYDILDRTNQYVYTIRDIENVITDLTDTIETITGDSQEEKDRKKKLEDAKNTWESLLNQNLAYSWCHDYVLPTGTNHAKYTSDPKGAFEEFRKNNDLPEDKSGEMETLIFSAGPTYEYSRKIAESSVVSYSTEVSVGTDSVFTNELETSIGSVFFGSGTKLSVKLGSTAAIHTGTSFGVSYDSGQESEQTVGFVLQDDDIGDNYTTRVYADPQWGTPIFFTDPGSITSDPWQQGTNKGVDIKFTLVDEPTGFPFDYHAGAFYNLRVSYTGMRELDSPSSIINFVIYAPEPDNDNNLVTKFNDHPEDDLVIGLNKSSPTANILFTAYPPERDRNSSDEKTYPVKIRIEEVEDSRIHQILLLELTFADLRAPRATITAPYDGQRISPEVFKGDKTFKIDVFSDDHDLAKIQLQIRSKRTDGVWEPWRNLSGMVWEDGGQNPNVTIVTYSDRDPVRRVFTFKWSGAEIANLGVGEYALRAVAQDKATRLKTDGSQEAKPNVDLDAPIVTFQVDGSKPTVLTSVPDYQARESERIYRGELSVLFNDDMRAGDFSDRTFYVTDFLNNSEKIAGFVAYSPALRKAIFVPVVPFAPNGFFRVEIKTDTLKEDGTLEKGVHDLAGNPLDNAFTLTFRTTDAPFEETWSITLAATDGTFIDANNIAAVAYGTLDGEDEQDARAVPSLTSQLRLSFLDRDKVEFERDIHPADGRLSHHWFFMVGNPQDGSKVQIFWNPSLRLRQPKPPSTVVQYQNIQLVEFDEDGKVTKTITLDPKAAGTESSLPIGEGALSFDGVDDYILIPDNDSLDMGTGSFTLEAWFKSNGDLTQDAWIYIKEETDAYPSYGFRVRADGSIRGGMQHNVPSTASTYTTYGSGYDDSKWHHIAMVVDRQNKTQKMFADGVQIGETDISSFGNKNMDGNADAYIGSYHDGNTGCAKATMDEVRVWKRALNQAEIQVNMNKSLTGNEEGLVGYWPFDEGSGTTTADRSLNGNNGTLHNGPTWVIPPRITGALAYEYTPAADETVRYFRLDVMKSNFFVATELMKGPSGWKFFSVPIKPERADPFVNLGDDIEPFKLYKYDTELSGYKIYPLDIGEVSLQPGYGYFTRLEKGVEVDIGGSQNQGDVTLQLETVGWYAIGNPFVKPVNVADLKLGNDTFATAVANGSIEGALYNWNVDPVGTDGYQVVDSSGKLESWEGYWLKTKKANLALTIPVPSGASGFIPPLPDSFIPPLSPTAVVSGLNSKKTGNPDTTGGQFNLQFALTSDFSSDLITTLGAKPKALTGYDSFDTSEPPTLGQTIAAYFKHNDWGDSSGMYNTDYQPPLKVGESRTWQLEVYTDRPDNKMRLSWERAIEEIPSDIMLYFRRTTTTNSENNELKDTQHAARNTFQDMRKVRFVDIESKSQIAKVRFEIRAERFEMKPLDDLEVVADEGQVRLKWTAIDNPFIEGYTIYRSVAQDSILASDGNVAQDSILAGESIELAPRKRLESNVNQFIDTDVEEEATYTYQVSVHFKTGAEVKSKPFIVTVLAVIKKTVLLQNYPNPFNPETWIPYELKKEASVTIELYNVSGQIIRTLDIGEKQRGRYISREKAAHWDGRNDYGERTASGVYFYVLKTKDFSATRKLAILK